eukprot:scaffold41099_cov40-Tisochrysis_lutea.AAC.1
MHYFGPSTGGGGAGLSALGARSSVGLLLSQLSVAAWWGSSLLAFPLLGHLGRVYGGGAGLLQCARIARACQQPRVSVFVRLY